MYRKWFLFVIAAGLVISGTAVGYEAEPNEWEDQNDYRIVRALPPTIDGVISPGEWDAAEWIDIDKKYGGGIPKPNDISDIHWANLWNPSTNLIYCVVYGTDTGHNFKTNMVDWNTQDDLEIYVDANQYNADYTSDEYAQHYFIGPTGDGKTWFDSPDECMPGGYASTVVGDVITYEFAITPWAYLDPTNVANSIIKTLQNGDWVGLDMCFVTCDDDKNTHFRCEHTEPVSLWSTSQNMLDLLLVNTLDPNRAHVSDPLSLSVLVSPNKTLWWMPGDYGDHHDIFFGDNYDDVLNATISSVPGGVFYTRQDSNSIERTVYNAAGELDLGKKYYWRVDEISDTQAPYEWTGDMWEFTVDTGQAKYPEPVDKAKDVVWGDILLSWTMGLKSVSSDVYFGDSYDAVKDADKLDPEFIRNQTDSNIGRADYHPSGPLSMAKTYYWRIDAINDLDGRSPWKGNVWSFSIANYLTIDDFESYADMAELKAVWGDNGYVLPQLCTTLPVLNGQSMFMQCFNFGFDAEVIKTFAAEQDWSETSAAGVKAVGLSYFGKASNTGDHLYIKLEDGTGKVAKMVMTDSESLQKEHWQQINFALADFTSPEVIDLGRIKKLIIGTGHGVNTGQNKIYVDNVRIYVSRCVPQYGPAGDVTDDCISNLRDIKNLALDWGITSWSVDVNDPDPCYPPVLHYLFDGDACDVSGNGYNGSVVDSSQPTYGSDRFGTYGKVLTFDGYSTYVDVPVDLFAGISEEITVSLWYYGDVWTVDNKEVIKTHRHLFFAENRAFHPYDDPCTTGADEANDTWDWRELNLYFQPGGTVVHAAAGNDANDVDEAGEKDPCDPNHTYGPHSLTANGTIEDVQQKWNHWAVTKDVNSDANWGELKLYLNGCLLASSTSADHKGSSYDSRLNKITDVGEFRIGAETGYDKPEDGGGLKGLVKGRMDDFRIYDYALTQGEICSLADMTPGTTYEQPIETLLKSSGSSTDVHVDPDRTINFKDFSAMAATWLQEQLWP